MTYDEIGIEELEEWLSSGARLVDVREPWEFTFGRLPGAVNVPMSEFVERLDEVPDNVVLVCSTGSRSGNVANYLMANGYTKVANLMPGTVGWREAGGELESGPVAGAKQGNAGAEPI